MTKITSPWICSHVCLRVEICCLPGENVGGGRLVQAQVPVLAPVGVTWTQDVMADTYGLQWYLLSVFLIVSETEITETTEDCM